MLFFVSNLATRESCDLTHILPFPLVFLIMLCCTLSFANKSVNSARRTYNLYIMYTPYYRTPRLYLSGYQGNGHPLPPMKMMEDIVGDYKDKTVTLEEFPFFANHVRMASVHPCKHAPVMKSLLDRADAALRLRREKLRASKKQSVDGKDVEGLTSELGNLDVKGAQDAADKDEWEEVQENEVDDQEVAIRVDQYLVVFLKVSFKFFSLYHPPSFFLHD